MPKKDFSYSEMRIVHDITVLGIDLSKFTARTQFLFAASSMFTVFILFGYVQVVKIV